MVLYSFLQIVGQITLQRSLSSFLLTKNLERNDLQIGYGIHFGWAIEGAIGSRLKIDASYLSPNVNMASRLEYLTKQFHSEIIFSDSFYNLLSQKMKEQCRMIDRLTVKGSIMPIRIYTIDIHIRNLTHQTLISKKRIGEVRIRTSEKKLQNRLKRDSIWQ